MRDLVDTTEMYLRTIYELEEEGIVPLRARIAALLDDFKPIADAHRLTIPQLVIAWTAAQPGITEQRAALCDAAGQAFYNTSKFTLRDLRARASQQQLRADFEAYLDGFSPNVQEISRTSSFATRSRGCRRPMRWAR